MKIILRKITLFLTLLLFYFWLVVIKHKSFVYKSSIMYDRKFSIPCIIRIDDVFFYFQKFVDPIAILRRYFSKKYFRDTTSPFEEER